jgi:hypothetical protein
MKRPISIPEFAKQMNALFQIKNGHTYLDTYLMQLTGKIELDILKLDDLLHERHGEYENNIMSMCDIALLEYGAVANAFIDIMLDLKEVAQ